MSANERKYNIVKNWGLFCFDYKASEKGVQLNCALNGKKKEDGSYGKGVPVSVFAPFDSCDIPEDDYTKCYIDVDGGVTVHEWTDKEGNLRSNLQIWADKVSKHNWE